MFFPVHFLTKEIILLFITKRKKTKDDIPPKFNEGKVSRPRYPEIRDALL